MSDPSPEDWMAEAETKIEWIREAAEALVSLCDSDLAEFVGETAEVQVVAAVLAERERCAELAIFAYCQYDLANEIRRDPSKS